MTSHKLQLLIFISVQSAFVILDLFEMWRKNGRPSTVRFISSHRATIMFLTAVWAVYFVIQNSLLAAMPSLEKTLTWLSGVFGLSRTIQHSTNGIQQAILVVVFLIVAYFVAAFFDYAIHRWVLHHPRFWLLHEYHHLPKLVFNGMPGISVRPFAALSIFVTYFGTSAVLVLALKWSGQSWLLDWFVAHLFLLILVFTAVGSASHSCFLRRYWLAHHLMRRVFLITPQEHILHHAARGNCNYGNFVSFWDRVFGTYVDPLRLLDEQLEIGLDYDQDFLGALCGGRRKLSEAVRQNYQLSLVCNLSCGKKEVQQ